MPWQKPKTEISLCGLLNSYTNYRTTKLRLSFTGVVLALVVPPVAVFINFSVQIVFNYTDMLAARKTIENLNEGITFEAAGRPPLAAFVADTPIPSDDGLRPFVESKLGMTG